MARDPLVTKPVIKLADIVEDAQFSFWEQVVKHLPLAEGGDFDPMSSYQFDLAIEEAVTKWWSYNASEPYDLDIGNGRILEGADCNCSADDDCHCEE
tara:strand:+ start:157 stop:447 length:291 start_codon:yes stop_codon:yes gene_type:complete